MTIAVVGSGGVGRTLGTRWRQAGYEVIWGVRDPSAGKAVTLAAGGARVTGVRDAVENAGVVVLAVPWKAVEDAVASCGDLSGKVVLDCTNPIRADFSGLERGGSTPSGGEHVQSLAPGAHVVKIFNSTGTDNMADPVQGGPPATMFYAGDDAGAKQRASELAAALGFEPVDAGPLTAARYLEPLAMLWIGLAFGGLGRRFVINLVRRD